MSKKFESTWYWWHSLRIPEKVTFTLDSNVNYVRTLKFVLLIKNYIAIDQ